MKRISVLLLAVVVGCGGGGGTGNPGLTPVATTGTASSITPTGSILNGTVIPNGLLTKSWFEYGTDSALVTFTSSTKQDAGNGMTSLAAIMTLDGLAAGTTYYFRFCAENSKGYSKGQIVSFTTSSPGDPPTVDTFSATSIRATVATVNGNVSPNGLETNVWFEWGTDAALISFSSTSTQSAGAGTISQSVNAVLTGLSTGTTYYYRIAASNSSGTTRGSILSFVPGTAPLISVEIVPPLPGGLVGTTFNLVVSVTSQYQQAGVTVRVDGGPELPLAFSTQANCYNGSCYPGWSAIISLDGMTKGNHNLVATATDIFGNSATASRVVIYDQKPVLSVSAPLLDYTVARPSIHVTATCTDDDPAGCESIRVDIYDSIYPAPIATSKDFIDQDVSLANWDGTGRTLVVTARDYANQETKYYRSVYVESSTRLVEVTSVSGKILDVSTDRILFLDGAALKIQLRSSSMETTVMNSANPIPDRAFLTPLGAIWVNQPDNVFLTRVLEWRGGAITDLGHPNSSSSLKVAGKYAIWSGAQDSDPYSNNLFLRDLEGGTTSTVSTTAGNWFNDVSDNGVVAWWGADDYQIRLGETQITFGPEQNIYPLTDGVNVVYWKGPAEGKATYLYDGTSEIELAAPIPGQILPQFMISNGYVAFAKQEDVGVVQVQLRSQTGTRQVSVFGTDSSPETLCPDGSLTFLNPNDQYLKARYLDSSTNKIGSGLGRAIQIGGVWHVVIGRSVFRVN